MKKFLIFIIILGIIIGLIHGFQSAPSEQLEEISSNSSTIQVQENQSTDFNLSISEVDTLNPMLTSNSHVSDILKLIYEPLVSYNYENELEPCLALEWGKMDDTTWLIKLRDNVFWHSDLKLSSQDVKYTIEMLQSANISSIYSQNVENIEKVETIDSLTFMISLKEID